MYKVLDIREYDSIDSGRLGYGTHSISIDRVHHIIAICEDTETGERSRFDFSPGDKFDWFGDTKYSGYTGDFAVIVPGDIIELKKTDTYTEVWRVK
jgi:hypothetical protein